jgi:hypothetical protein
VLWSWATFCEGPVTPRRRLRNDRATSPKRPRLDRDLRDGLLGTVAACERDGLHIAVAFGWIFALVLGVSVALAMAVTWIAAARMRRKRDSSLPPPT